MQLILSLRRLLPLVFLLGTVATVCADDWPQWRGPHRDNISKETELRTEWPKDGPPLLWKADGVGRGFSPVSVHSGRLYTVGYGETTEFVTALDRGTGKEVWSTTIQNDNKQAPGMSWLNQRPPTTDGERVYAVTAFGVLVCLDADLGKEIWRKDYVKDFNGKRTGWGYCDYPLIDGDKLIVTPGGPEAKILALDRKTGDVIWKAAIPGTDVADYSPLQVAEIGGVRQYVQMLSKGVVAVNAKDGAFLWRFDKANNGTINVPAPLIRGDEIFCSGAYGKNSVLIRVKRDGEKWTVEEEYVSKEFRLDNWSTGPIRVGEDIFGTNGNALLRLDWKTGKRSDVPRATTFDRTVATLHADGHLYLRGVNNTVTLLELTPKEVNVTGSFKLPSSKFGGWSVPVISGGKLFLREQDDLYCYDLRPEVLPLPRPREEKKPEPPAKDQFREPDAIFLPTPTDIVEKLLDLAAVKKTDVVADLGCGDGRIVVTAAKRFGCQAVGCDLDPACVEKAQALAKEQSVEALVRIERQDLFEVDLAGFDVVALYLLPELNRKLLPRLETMKRGSRIVSHNFPLPGMQPDQTLTLTSKEDGAEHTIWLYTIPLRRASRNERK